MRKLFIVLLGFLSFAGCADGAGVITCPGGYVWAGTACPTGAPSPEPVAPIGAPLDGTGIGRQVQAASQAANSIQLYGGEVVFVIDIQRGFDSSLYKNVMATSLEKLQFNLQGGAGLETVNQARKLADEVWKVDFESWARSGGLRVTEITIATFDRGTPRWRDEIWVNSRRVAVCPVVEIEEVKRPRPISLYRIISKCGK